MAKINDIVDTKENTVTEEEKTVVDIKAIIERLAKLEKENENLSLKLSELN